MLEVHSINLNLDRLGVRLTSCIDSPRSWTARLDAVAVLHGRHDESDCAGVIHKDGAFSRSETAGD